MKRYLWITAVGCLLLGALLIGNGAAMYMATPEESGKSYWYGLGAVAEEEQMDPEERDLWNKILINNRKYMTIENALFVKEGERSCRAGISNAEGSELTCTVTIIRESTNEVLYQSKLIDPGYYIEYIELLSEMKEGYYPCTVIWTFYEVDGEDIIGEMAEKAVVIVEK